MIPRAASVELKRLAREFKAVVVTGPRQSGKTTLVRAVFPKKPYALLEEPDTRAFAEDDPRGFLAQYPRGAILDEVQRAPELFSYLQGVLDRGMKAGQFVLTGSCNFGLMERITQSLAGRVGIVQLLPFSFDELAKEDRAPANIDALLFEGLFPAIHDRRPRVPQWYGAYVMTYLERDVHQLASLKDFSVFQRFLRLCAANIGQLLNTVRLGSDCGVHHTTIKSWLSILESSYIVFLLRPHSRNFRKRLVKTPKLYFHDTGLAARLLGIEEELQVAGHPLRGALFENWCVTELLKSRYNRGLPSNLYFWRNHIGTEIDIVADHGRRLLPVEVKSGATVAADWLKALERWRELAGDATEMPWLVYGGDDDQKRSAARIVSWRNIGKLAGKV